MADVILKVKAEDEATAELAKVDKLLKGMKASYTELNNTLETAQKIWRLFNKVMDATIGQTMALAKEVRDAARAMGTSYQESSRLIALSGDLEISTGTLTTAFKALSVKELPATIDSLKKLSAQYITLPTQVDKNKFAMDNFAKSGLEMEKILELGPAKIDAMAASHEKYGIILDEKAIVATENFRLALDDAQDEIKGVTTTLTIGLLPSLTNALNKFNEFADAWNKNKNFLDWMKWEAGQQAIAAFSGAEDQAAIATQKLNESLANGTQAFGEFTPEVVANYQAAQKLANSTKVVADDTAETRHQIDLIRKSFTSYTGVVKIVDKATDGAAQAMGFYAKRAREADRNSRSLAAGLKATSDAQKALADAQLEWTQGVGQDAAGLLGKYLWEGGTKYAAALQQIDEHTGTNLVEQKAYNDSMEALNLAYSTGKINAAEYGEGLDAISENYESLNEPLVAAREELDKVNADWGYLIAHPSVDLTVVVHYEVEGSVPTGVPLGGTDTP